MHKVNEGIVLNKDEISLSNYKRYRENARKNKTLEARITQIELALDDIQKVLLNIIEKNK